MKLKRLICRNIADDDHNSARQKERQISNLPTQHTLKITSQRKRSNSNIDSKFAFLRAEQTDMLPPLKEPKK
jgi:hypothetical protein